MSKLKQIVTIALAGLAFILMTNIAKAESTTPQELMTKISDIPVKLQSHISSEIVKTKEFQKASWEKSKIQFANLKKLFIKN